MGKKSGILNPIRQAEYEARLAIRQQQLERDICEGLGDCSNAMLNSDQLTEEYTERRALIARQVLEEWLDALSPYDILYASDSIVELFAEHLAWEGVLIWELCAGFDKTSCDEYQDHFAADAETIISDIADAAVIEIRQAKDACDDTKLVDVVDGLIVVDQYITSDFKDTVATRLGFESSDTLQKDIRQDYACHLDLLLDGFPERFQKGSFDVSEFTITLFNKKSSSNAPLEGIEVALTTRGEGCGNIESDRDVFTDASGSIVVRMTANNAEGCSEPTNKVILYVEVDDNRASAEAVDHFFLGRSFKLEAAATNCRAIIPTGLPSGALKSSADTEEEICEDLLITVSPDPATLTPGETQQFTATVTGSANTDVTWTATGGTIDAAGSFTAGAQEGAYEVTATSVEDPSVSTAATVTIADAGVPNLTGVYVGTALEFYDTGELEDEHSVIYDVVQTGNDISIEDRHKTDYIFEGTISGSTISARGTNCDRDGVPCELSAVVELLEVEGVPEPIIRLTGTFQDEDSYVRGDETGFYYWEFSVTTATD